MKNIQLYDDFINEGISNFLYHFTNIPAAIGILKSDKMFASSVMSNSADGAADYGDEEAKAAKAKRDHAKYVKAMNWHHDAGLPEVELTKDDEYRKMDYKNRGKHFYISFQRTGNGKMGYAGRLGLSVRLVFDGKKLSNHYKGTPIDYWTRNRNLSFWKTPEDLNNNNELEDRLTLDSPTLPNVTKYILEIHCMVWENSTDRESYEALQSLGEERNIPVLFYTNNEAYTSQDKKACVPLADIYFEEPKFKREKDDGYSMGTNYASNLLARLIPFFIYKDPANRELIEKTFSLSDFPHLFHWENNYHTYVLNNKYPHKDDITRLQRELYSDVADIRTQHNPYLVEMNRLLSKDMRKYKAKTTIEYVTNKLAAIKAKEADDLEVKRNEIIAVCTDDWRETDCTADKVEDQFYDGDLRDYWAKKFNGKHLDALESFIKGWDNATMGDYLTLCKKYFRKEEGLRKHFEELGFKLKTFRDIDKKQNPWDYR